MRYVNPFPETSGGLFFCNNSTYSYIKFKVSLMGCKGNFLKSKCPEWKEDFMFYAMFLEGQSLWNVPLLAFLICIVLYTSLSTFFYRNKA